MRFETQRRGRERPRIEMLPMIDVITFLLVFFMLFTTFKTVESGIEVDLPRAATGGQTAPAQLVVTITQSGAIYLDGRLSNLAGIRQAAEALARQNPQATLVIRGDSRSYWEHAVGVMDAARQGGISRFAFGTQPPETR